MENTPIWQILNRLSTAETASLEQMAATPLLGGAPELSALLRFLVRAVARQAPPDRTDCYRAMFPDRSFNAAHFRQWLHRLTELARQMLIRDALEANPTVRNRLLADRLEQMELGHLSRQALLKAEKALDHQPLRDPGWHEERFQVRRLAYSSALEGARTRELNLQDFSDDLEKAFMLRKLKLACELISHSAVYRSNYDFGLLDAVLNQISHSPTLLCTPEIAVYYHCCLALMHPEASEHFEQMKPLLYRIAGLFPAQECRDLLLLALNYCIRKLNQGQTHYAHEGLELYNLALDQGFLLEKGEMSRFTFRNAVAMGLKIGALDWVEQFIFRYRDHLPRAHRESMVSFNLARLAYERRHYEQALSHLQKADYHDILLNLSAKTMLLKIYYETRELRLLDAAIDAFKIFLRRKKVLAYHRDNYQNFIRYMEKLVALNPASEADKKHLRQAVAAEDTLTEKEWFLRWL